MEIQNPNVEIGNQLQQYIRVPENQDGGYQSTRISGESQTEKISNPDALKP